MSSEPKDPTTQLMRATPRLVLIDGFAILHRAYHALPPLTNRSGELLNAVYGFCTMLFKVINDLSPSFLVVALDLPGSTFRHEEFIGYQAKRPRMDIELSGQVRWVKEILEAMGIPIFELEGYEADDIIGTLSSKAWEKKIQSVIVTGDKDLFQLVKKGIKIFAPVRGLSQGEILDSRKVQERMGVEPSQIVDYKALVGDSSDNYPGVSGIGPKTAVALLEKFGNLNKIYQNLNKVEKDFGETMTKKLVDGQESAWLSYKLAKIITDLPIKLKLETAKFEFSQEEKKATIEKLKELGLKSLAARLEGKNKKQPEKDEKNKQLILI